MRCIANKTFSTPFLGQVNKGDVIAVEGQYGRDLIASGKLSPYETKVVINRPLVGPESDASSSRPVRRRKITRSKRSKATDE